MSISETKSLNHRLTFLLNNLVSILIDATAPEFRKYGLSIPAARVLIALFEKDSPLTVGNLSQTIATDLSTVSHILRRLEKQELILRKRLQNDNRVVHIELTKQGSELAETCYLTSIKHEDLLLLDFSNEEIIQLKELIFRITENASISFRNYKID